MQRNGATPAQNAAPFFSSSFFNTSTVSSASSSETRESREARNKLQKERDRSRDRRPSFGRKTSFGSPSKRRASSSAAAAASAADGGSRPPGINRIVTDTTTPPALPDFALQLAAAAKLSRETDVLQSPASADSFSKMLSRTAPTPANGYSQLAPPAPLAAVQSQPSESSMVHQHIQETANKRISTLDYLRKAHEGRVYWFNTLLFDKPDLARMPYFSNPSKLARRATNYLLLGLSLPAVIDLNSSTASDFLRSLNTLLSEFDAFQALHPDSGSSSSGSLSRARLPQMFKRATAGATGKGRRSSSSAANTDGYALDQTDSNDGGGYDYGGGYGAMGQQGQGQGSVISFAHSEANADLLPGEEYTHLLTPSLPFDPDFFETFATLCDVLIDCYTRLLSLVVAPRDCGGAVGELFAKADAKVRKILVQGVVKEFEDSSRAGIKTEVANVGRVVLGGLM
ncbi:hypothetical protein CONLIGDRAFT_141293 [Coniochaeta ligniaria NRRL 30616]|uniref:Uncharacterized protein n=1 Tax=Coniochaeta ligniaria NRRL 30616 TaxID=1408157 RepID=A0A1J7I7U8_9PEZI|nr:hypothetical protein CONLIGDRAFT_141293 [Coniochaeta ligniaria NRRL 30616]